MDENGNNINQEPTEAEKTQSQDERNTANNAKNLDTAASVAMASGVPVAMAAGGIYKAANTLTGGQVGKLAGGIVNQATKIAPGGKQIQNLSNNLSESGASDVVGKVADIKGAGAGSAASSAGASAGSAAAKGASSAGNAAGKSGSIASPTAGATPPPTGANTPPPTSSNNSPAANPNTSLSEGTSFNQGNNSVNQAPTNEESETETEEQNEIEQQLQEKSSELKEEQDEEKTPIVLKAKKAKILLMIVGGLVSLFAVVYVIAFISYYISGGAFSEFWDDLTSGIKEIFKTDESYLDRCYNYWGKDDQGEYICTKTKSFYKKFDTELKKYEAKGVDVPEQLILYTIFYNYDMTNIEECDAEGSDTTDPNDTSSGTKSNGQQTASEDKGCAYNYGDEEIDAKFDEIEAASENGGSGLENLDLSIFKEEKDTIKVLFKNLVKTHSVCNLSITTCQEVTKTITDPDTGEEREVTTQENCDTTNERIENNTDASWWDIVKNGVASIFGTDIEGCQAKIADVAGTRVEDGITYVTTASSKVTYENKVDLGAYKQYLVESEFFDSRERFDKEFSEYAEEYGLEVEELDEDDKKEVRTRIWQDLLFLSELEDVFYQGITPTTLANIIGQCETISVEMADGSIKQVPLEEYVMGVVYAEFRGARNSEMYKAQAIAARSYVVKKTNSCTTTIKNSSRAQNYDPTVLTSNDQYSVMIREAVNATAGQLIIVNGEVLLAEYDAFCYDTKTGSNYKICQQKDLVPTSWVSSHVSNPDGLNERSHGRGMSQYGALYLITARGYNHSTVLNHYYGSNITLGTMVADPSSYVDPNVPYTGGTLAEALQKTGSSVMQANATIAAAVASAGGRTRAGVVAAATSLAKVLSNAKFPLLYYYGGKFDNLGVDGTWGTSVPGKKSPSGPLRYQKGIDCSGFTYWAFKQAGITISHGSSGQKSSGVPRANLESGQPGDLAIKSGHVVLILSRTANGYMIAESAGGSMIREFTYSYMRSKAYTIYNTDQNFR